TQHAERHRNGDKNHQEQDHRHRSLRSQLTGPGADRASENPATDRTRAHLVLQRPQAFTPPFHPDHPVENPPRHHTIRGEC
ncbi:hypothetical protein, partial [Hyphomicrobium sp.]|uniref:hypothetical protein n=1 Tax=Hyphomicrobium sp. TaxID=82 RepID=UPI002C006324